ncbi:MAG: transcriptional regulator [Rhizobiales bacterium]|nr:transcriptional regulator [Hyphomicrobiales bacterium]
MNISHHLDEATVLALAAGTLGEALEVVARGHIDWCPTCRSGLARSEAVGGAMLEAAEPAEVAAGAFEALLTRAREADKVKRLPVRTGAGGEVVTGVLPASVARRIGGGIETVTWKWLAPGIRYSKVALSPGESGDLRFLMIEPGRKVPEHGHGGAELTLVLSGAYRDSFGLFQRGDVADMDEEIDHEPVVTPGLPCVCLVATEDKARFRTLKGRLAQPFIGM